ncbi:NOC3 like DNA replication regulator [Cricetulus griseus]
MKARRNKKQVPSFRKLIKTSKVKLENKLKNKQFKQQSTIKKYRKEQRKLRQAVKDAVSKKPFPLEDPKSKRPVKGMEREEEDEEDQALPLDMMDDDDLQLMKDLGQKASFLTRDLSSSEPVHIKKRKHESVIDKYEKMPRTLQTAPEKELIHLLPIKDKSGIIPQTREKPVTDIQQEEEDEEELEVEEEVVENPIQELTIEEHLIVRKKKLQEKKIQIATLASSILSDPESNIKKLKELRSMLMEQDPDVAVTVRKLVIISLMELFKDITPSYKIRPLTEAEKSTKIRKETQKLREFEEGLVSQYKFYLENLEQIVKDWKQRKLKKSNVVSLKAYKGLAEVAVKSLCELLVALPHFNFHNNIIVLIVPLMNDGSKLWKKAEEKLERELREAEASESTERKLKLHTETLNIVFVTYFRILKKAQRSPLLPAVLEGLAKTDLLLDNESQGSGVFLPELEEPEYCNAQNTALWELHALRRHYHPVVQRFAVHLLAGAPSEGSEALKPELSRRINFYKGTHF